MNIFKQIKNSVYNKEYYKSTVLVESTKSSVKYLLKISALIALIASIIFAIASPFIFKAMKGEISSVVAGYPNDLVISIKDGNASINQPEPYIIKVPLSMATSSVSENNPKVNNLIVINTSEPFSIDKFKEYSTLSLLTKNNIAMMSNNGEIKIMSLSEFGNVDISKTWLEQKANKTHQVLPWLLVGMAVLVYLGIFIFEIISSLIIILLYALVVWGFLKNKGIEVTYGRAYQVAIHASTLALIMGSIGNIIKPLDNLFLKLIVVGIVAYFNFDKLTRTDMKEIKEEVAQENREEESEK